jgi:hypothetical protein
MNLIRTMVVAVSTVAFTLLIAGCVCPANRKAGFPHITCQPIDNAVPEGKSATFAVKASGKDLRYQWYFRRADGKVVAVGTNSQMELSQVNGGNVGSYWCEIESHDSFGDLTQTRTRSARLGLLTKSIAKPSGGQKLMSETNIVILGEQQPMPPGSQGRVCNSDYCGYVLFNNGGAKYYADKTRCAITVQKLVGGVLTDIPVGEYELQWRYGLSAAGCATNVPPITKQFKSVLGKNYTFTVYFKPTCPTADTPIILNVDFLPPQ